jgi:pyruvate dehydrogenase E1 component alpha subunit
MRSTKDCIQGLKQKVIEWGVLTETQVKDLDKDARSKVDKEAKEAEAAAEFVYFLF